MGVFIITDKYKENFSDEYILKEYKVACEIAIKKYKTMIEHFKNQIKEIEEITTKGSKANNG